MTAIVPPEKAIKFQKSLVSMQSQQLFKDILEAQKKNKKKPAAAPAVAKRRTVMPKGQKNRKDRRKDVRKEKRKEIAAKVKQEKAALIAE